jgi:protein involved in polysaccharide export with SLBB domain
MALLCVLSCGGLSGCEFGEKISDALKTDKTRFIAPHQAFRKPERPSIAPILTTTGAADVTEEILPNAEFPVESDYEYSDEDYIMGPNDVLDIGVLDLFQPGQETVVRRQIESSGFIDLPLLDERIRAEDLTARELRQEIVEAYSPDLLRDPRVSVTLVARRQSTFSVLGAVARPGTFDIPRRDMRLLDALALTGGLAVSADIPYIYVIRPRPARRITTEEAPVEPAPVPAAPPTEAPAEPTGAPSELPTALPPVPDGETPEDEIPEPDEPSEEPSEETEPPSETPGDPASDLLDHVRQRRAASLGAEQVDAMKSWIYRDGRWVRRDDAPIILLAETDDPSGVGPGIDPDDIPVVAAPVVSGPVDEADPFGWNRAAQTDMARIIAVNLAKLRDGDPRMNIIVRPNDILRVPNVAVGEFYIMGEVSRPGVYSLTGRRVTVKMALAAAGNLGPLAWPSNSLLVRRIGQTQEQVIPLDIEKIIRSEDSDIFLKPNDVIAVGTHWEASFMAVIRNAFRMTYGGGFIYDRNFGDPYVPTLDSKRFTRW